MQHKIQNTQPNEKHMKQRLEILKMEDERAQGKSLRERERQWEDLEIRMLVVSGYDM